MGLSHRQPSKGLLPGHMSRDDYLAASTVLDDLELVRRPDSVGVERAAALAADRSLRFFDALFIDLALEVGVPLLTSDARLARATAELIDTVLLRGIEP